MDFSDQLKQFAKTVQKRAAVSQTEEATKNALIMPFLQILGYDVFNPTEFVPEFTADVGIKKGEKVDYAIMKDDKPIILIEAKWCGAGLEKHDSQLFRYFATCNVKLAILTNGIIYRFYTDLDEANKMDLTPFLEVNLLDLKDNHISELKRFQKNSLDLDGISDAASDLKYTSAIKQLLSKVLQEPTDAFINYVLSEVYDGRKTAVVVEKFKPIVKRSFTQYISDIINDRLKSAMDTPTKVEPQVVAEPDEPEEPENGIITTEEELEAYVIIKTLLHDIVAPERIYHKDTRSYFSIIIDNKRTNWICRLQLTDKRKVLFLPGLNGDREERIDFTSNNDLYKHKDILATRARPYV